LRLAARKHRGAAITLAGHTGLGKAGRGGVSRAEGTVSNDGGKTQPWGTG